MDGATATGGSAAGGGTTGAPTGAVLAAGAAGAVVGDGVDMGEVASLCALRNSFIASPALRANFGSWLPPNRTTTAIINT